jgi:hypothetical protein
LYNHNSLSIVKSCVGVIIETLLPVIEVKPLLIKVKNELLLETFLTVVVPPELLCELEESK